MYLLLQNQPHYLLELLKVVFDLFRGVAHAHETVLSAIHRVIVRRKFFLLNPLNSIIFELMQYHFTHEAMIVFSNIQGNTTIMRMQNKCCNIHVTTDFESVKIKNCFEKFLTL